MDTDTYSLVSHSTVISSCYGPDYCAQQWEMEDGQDQVLTTNAKSCFISTSRTLQKCERHQHTKRQTEAAHPRITACQRPPTPLIEHSPCQVMPPYACMICMYSKVCTSLDTESRLDAPVSGLPSMGKDHQFASTVIPLTKDLTSQMERTHQPSSTYHVSETLLVYCPKVKKG
jgi:hypothetical protein